MVWARTRGEVPRDIAEILVHGAATRAWVVAAESGWEPGYEAGPTYRIDFHWEWQGKLYDGRYRASFDGLHVGYGPEDHSSWLGSCMEEGGSITVVFHRDSPQKARIYGNLGLYLRKTLRQSVAELMACGPDGVEAKTREVYELIRSPLGRCEGDWGKYLKLLTKIGIYDDLYNRWRPEPDNLEFIRTGIRNGTFDQAAVNRLSALCERHCPGIWAAT